MEINRRLRSKQFLLTCSNVKEEHVLEELVGTIMKMENPVECTIRREKHQSGFFHFHVLLLYPSRREYRPTHFNYIFNKHLNITIVKSYIGAIDYILKAGDYFSSNPSLRDKIPLKKVDFVELLESERREVVVDRMRRDVRYAGRIPSLLLAFDLVKENTRALNLQNKVPFTKRIDIEARRRYFTSISVDQGLLEKYIQILEILDISFRYPFDRPFKSMNLYITGNTNKGKSRFVSLLRDKLRRLVFPRDKWFSSYHDKTYQVILWDEVTFKGISLEDLNLLLEGSPIYLEIKGGKLFKDDNPLFIMCSNLSLKENFLKKKGETLRRLEPLNSRIKEITLENNESLFIMIEYLESLFFSPQNNSQSI